MVFNFLDQIFGQSNCRTREVITTTIVDSDNENDDMNTTNNCCLHPMSSASSSNELAATTVNSSKYNHRSPQRKPLDQSSVYCEQRNHNSSTTTNHKLNEISFFSIYILFASLFICICTIAVLLITYINRVTDLAQIRDGLKGEFIGKDDIDIIVRNVLNDLKDDEQLVVFRRR